MNEIEQTLEARGNQYGDYDSMSGTVQALKRVMRNTPNWVDLPPAMQESLDLMATKIGRILTGNAFNGDSWRDIEGYARLGRDRSFVMEVVEPTAPDPRWTMCPGSIMYYEGREVVVLERPDGNRVRVALLGEAHLARSGVKFWFSLFLADLNTPSNVPSEDDFKSAQAVLGQYRQAYPYATA